MKIALSVIIMSVISIAYAMMAIINIDAALNAHQVKTVGTTIPLIIPAAIQPVPSTNVHPDDKSPGPIR